jgi:hypothetical protein
MYNSDIEGLNIEDAFVSDEAGWITLPGNEGKISPSGIVYDRNGEELYSIYEDVEPTKSRIIYDQEDYEWM